MKRPRFSLRTLAIVVTLVCAYFGAWEATKRIGVGDVERSVNNPVVVDERGVVFENVERFGSRPLFDDPRSPSPFVITVNQYDYRLPSNPSKRKSYFWFFGFILPRNTITVRDDQIGVIKPPEVESNFSADDIRKRMNFFKSLQDSSDAEGMPAKDFDFPGDENGRLKPKPGLR